MNDTDKSIKQLRDELEKRETYWRDWNGRAANRNAKLEHEIETLQKQKAELLAAAEWLDDPNTPWSRSVAHVSKVAKRIRGMTDD